MRAPECSAADTRVELLLHGEPGESGNADAGSVTGSPSRGWQTDIISSPEMHPAAATVITAGLAQTSNNQEGLVASMFYAHTLTHLCVHTQLWIHVIARTRRNHRHGFKVYLIL